jgi:glycosyltransferase involved in cell wall biosynthesis
VKILIYTHGFAPIIGGAEKYVMLLADGLARRTATAAAQALVVNVVTPTPAGEFDDTQLPFQVARQPSFLALARLIHQSDILHLSGPCLLPLILGSILKKPIVIEHHGYTASCPNGLLLYEPDQSVCSGHFLAGRYRHCLKCVAFKEGLLPSFSSLLWTFLRRWLCQRVRVNAPITHHVLERLRLPQSKVIYYGIPTPLDSIGSVEALATNKVKGLVRFGYVGRLVPLKGLPVLVQAAKFLKGKGYFFRLKFIGDGPQRTELQSMVRDLQLNEVVEFVGFVSGDRLRDELKDVSALIMPSIWEETAGLAAIEQMMRGQLVIVSDIGGLREVVGDAGLKCIAGDANSLAACMKRVLDEPDIVEKMGKAAQARALSLFQQEGMVDTYLKLYQKLSSSEHVSNVLADSL